MTTLLNIHAPQLNKQFINLPSISKAPNEVTCTRLMIQDLVGRTHILNIPEDIKTIADLISHISSWSLIPLHDLRCVHQGKELLLYKSSTLKEFGLRNDDVILMKLRLKGGGSGCQLEQDFIPKQFVKPPPESGSFQLWQKVSNALKLTPDILSGGLPLIDPIIGPKDTSLTGENAAKLLEAILGEDAYVIHPNVLSLAEISRIFCVEIES